MSILKVVLLCRLKCAAPSPRFPRVRSPPGSGEVLGSILLCWCDCSLCESDTRRAVLQIVIQLGKNSEVADGRLWGHPPLRSEASENNVWAGRTASGSKHTSGTWSQVLELPVSANKNTPPDKKTGWEISFDSTKSEAGSHLFSLPNQRDAYENTASAVRCDMVLHPVFRARHLWANM